jgi:hypothetical protein
MIKITNKMPVVVVLLVFSFLIAAWGLGAAGFLMVFRFKDMSSLIYAFLILAGSVLLAVLIRMFANIGQMIFDVRIDIQKLTDNLIQSLQAIIQKLDEYSRQSGDLEKRFTAILDEYARQARDLEKRFTAIKDNFDQMNCDSKDMNQNIYQIRAFFEQIEKHLDLKK